MKEEPHYPSIDPELEARIVALVLGEASDFERDDLNRLIEQRPELAAFKEEMQRVHGLLGDVGAGESVAEDDDWKLSAEKRNAVLAAISPEAKQQPVQLGIKSADPGRSKHRSILSNIAKIAAVFCIAGFFGSMAISSWLTATARRQLASSETSIRSSIVASESLMGEASAPGAHILMSDGAMIMTTGDEHLPAAEPTANTEDHYQKNSKSSLSGIRDSLGADVALPSPYYLMDDVQYVPAHPNLNLPQEAIASGEAGAADMPMRAPSAGVNGPGSGLSLPTVDDLALVPQGLERSGAAAPKDGLAWQDSHSFYFGLADRESNRARGSEDASKQMAGMGMAKGMATGDRRAAKGKPESSPELAMPALGVQESGQGQSKRKADVVISDSPARAGRIMLGGTINSDAGVTETEPTAEEASQGLTGGTNLRISIVPPEDWSAAGEAMEIARATRDGDGQEDEHLGDERFGRELDAEKASDPDLLADSHISLPSIPSPTKKSMSLRVEFERKEAAEGLKEEFAKDRQIALREGQILDEGEPNDQQISVGVTGTIGLPRGTQPKTPVQLAVNEPSRRYRYIPPMLEDNSESMKRKQATSDAWATRVNREWLEKLARPQQESESMRMAPAKRYVAPSGLNENNAAEESFSTFSLHVSDVSFKLARAALASGTWPEAAKVRIEEFVNAFDYGDPAPSQSEKVACRVEQSVHPFLQQRNLLRVSMRTAAAGRSSNTPLRLTFLLDNSGSMERIDRQQTVRRAFALLAGQLEPIDQVTLISFARQPRLLADKVSGAQSSQLVGLIDNLPSEGGTNIEAALQLGFEKAREQQLGNAQNRIILLTDGAVNLGDANPESLSRMITTMRGAGIAFDAAGISAEGLNDDILEALTRKGDGRYYLLDSLEAADDGFARQIAGALRPSAKNVKVQIEFNPKRVGRYKLLGFEKHRLKQEDFRNDQVDAAEMAAAEAGVAVYQFEAKPDGEGDVGSVSVRFRDVSTQQMIENCWPIPYQPDAPRLDQAAPSLRIATCAALLAAKLRGEALGETVDLKTLSNLIAGLPEQDRNSNRVGQLQQMIGQARQVSGK